MQTVHCVLSWPSMIQASYKPEGKKNSSLHSMMVHFFAGSMSGQAESASASTARQIEATGPAAVATVQAIQATAVGKPPPGGALTQDQQQAGPSSTQHDHPKLVPSQDAQKPGTSAQIVLEDEPQSSEGEPPLSVLWAAVSCVGPSSKRTSHGIYSDKHACISQVL